MNKSLMKRATVGFFVFAMLVCVVYAIYWVYSNEVSVSVSNYTLDLQPLSQSVNKNTYVTFTATLQKDGSPLEGATVYLYKSGDLTLALDSAITDSTGQCTLTYYVTEAEGSTLFFKAGYEVP